MPMPTPELQRAYQRQWVRRRREQWFADKVCVRCGDGADLHLHHLVPDEKVSHSIWSWSQSRREAELAKCIVLCRDCHVSYHAVSQQRHGTRKRYQMGCRCEPCRAAKSAANRRYRDRRKAKDSASKAPDGSMPVRGSQWSRTGVLFQSGPGSADPGVVPLRPRCDGCRRQRRCETVEGRRLCAECRRQPDLALMRVLIERAMDGAVE